MREIEGRGSVESNEDYCQGNDGDKKEARMRRGQL